MPEATSRDVLFDAVRISLMFSIITKKIAEGEQF
jgi:hypothetical protein